MDYTNKGGHGFTPFSLLQVMKANYQIHQHSASFFLPPVNLGDFGLWLSAAAGAYWIPRSLEKCDEALNKWEQ